MKLQKKHIIGIAIVGGSLVLGLVIWFLFKASDEEYYEGETAPIETAQDVFDDEQEDSTSESSDGETNADASGDDEKDTNEDSSAENDAKEDGAKEDGTKGDDTKEDGAKEDDAKEDGGKEDDANESDNGTKEEENVDTNIDEGWTPFY